MKKSFILINSLLTFIISFFIHGIYEWIPSIITTIFPVNESIYEHMKLIFLSPLISSSIMYFIYQKKEITYANFFFAFFVSSLFNIIIFYLLYLPIYYDIGENLVVTLIVYFITILLSQWVNYLLIHERENKKLNFLGLILTILTFIIMNYFTWNPLNDNFFLDPITNTYGIKKVKC